MLYQLNLEKYFKNVNLINWVIRYNTKTIHNWKIYIREIGINNDNANNSELIRNKKNTIYSVKKDDEENKIASTR